MLSRQRIADGILHQVFRCGPVTGQGKRLHAQLWQDCDHLVMERGRIDSLDKAAAQQGITVCRKGVVVSGVLVHRLALVAIHNQRMNERAAMLHRRLRFRIT